MTYSKTLGIIAILLIVIVPIIALVCYPAETARIELFIRDIAFRFRVTDADSGNPIQGVTIKLSYTSEYPLDLNERPKVQILTTDAEGYATFIRKNTLGDDFYSRWGRERTEVDRHWGEISISAERYSPRTNAKIADIRIKENGTDPETGTMRFDVPITMKKR